MNKNFLLICLYINNYINENEIIKYWTNLMIEHIIEQMINFIWGRYE